MERIVWDRKLKAFVDTKTGRLIAPRLEEEGIDLFFVENRNEKKARARYCIGERYWAFPFSREEIEKIIEDYKPILEHIERIGLERVKKLLKENV